MKKLTDKEFEAKVSKAEKFVANLDEIDGHQDRAPGTILAALEAGLKDPSTNAQFDAFVMIKDLFKRAAQSAKN